jgi:hypothetical protein
MVAKGRVLHYSGLQLPQHLGLQLPQRSGLQRPQHSGLQLPQQSGLWQAGLFCVVKLARAVLCYMACFGLLTES